jgi:hypothetical protein
MPTPLERILPWTADRYSPSLTDTNNIADVADSFPAASLPLRSLTSFVLDAYEQHGENWIEKLDRAGSHADAGATPLLLCMLQQWMRYATDLHAVLASAREEGTHAA